MHVRAGRDRPMDADTRDAGQGDRTRDSSFIASVRILFYANHNRFADRCTLSWSTRRRPVHWFVVDAGAITDIDYSAAQSIRDLLDELVRQKVNMIFARVRPSLHSDMDRHRVTAMIGDTQVFATLREALAAVRGGAPRMSVDL